MKLKENPVRVNYHFHAQSKIGEVLTAQGSVKPCLAIQKKKS